MGESDTKTYQQPDAKETERFWAKIWKPKKHNENAEWINNITRELDGLEEGPKMEIHIDLLKTTLKRIWNSKAPGHDGIHSFWFKKFTSIHGRLALEMNRCLQDAHVPEWMTKGNTTLIHKDPRKGTAPKQLLTHNLPPNDVENTNSTNKGKIYYSLTSRGLFPDEQKGCRKGSRGIAELLFIDQHILNESKTRRKNLAMAWIQEGIWYAPTKLDITQNVQNITWNHKLHRTDHEDLESGADSWGKKQRWNKDPKRHLPSRCTIALTIHNSHDATEPHAKKMHCRIQTQQITREEQPPNVQ